MKIMAVPELPADLDQQLSGSLRVLTVLSGAIAGCVLYPGIFQ